MRRIEFILEFITFFLAALTFWAFLWIAWAIILGQVVVFPVLARRRDLLRPLTAVMGGLLFIGNLVIVLSYLDLLGPF